MIGDITPVHYAQILRINQDFVHWLSPWDEAAMLVTLEKASYKKQIDDAQGVLIGYAHDADYTDAEHKNLRWLRTRFDAFYYIDRIIIDVEAQGKSYGRLLYDDFETEARKRGLPRLVCEVNTRPNNPASHKFHLRMGFEALEDVDYPHR